MIIATKETKSAIFLVASLAAFLLLHSVAIGAEADKTEAPAGTPPASTDVAKPAEVKPEDAWKKSKELISRFNSHELNVKELREAIGT